MSAKKIALLIDSTANLPSEIIEQYDIHVIPLHVNWDDQSLLDGVDITTEEFYERLQRSKSNPTTSQPSAGEFLEMYQRIAQEADAIVGLFISEPLSGTLSSARTAKEMMEDFPIEIVDTRSTSMGLGLMAVAAGKAIAAGHSAPEVAEMVRGMVPKTRIVFVVDTLEYLHRGGRIGGAKRLIGSMLSIKPLLHLVEGKIEPLASVRTKKKAVKHMIDTVKEEMAGKEGVQIAVLHAVAEKEAQRIAEELKAALNPKEVIVGDLSPVIGTHVGPGAVGVAYYAE